MADAKSPKKQKPDVPTLEPVTPAKKSNKALYIIIGAVALFIFIMPALLFILVFGFIKNKLNKTTTTVTASVQKDSTTVMVNTEADIKLPADWPAAVVVYTPSTMTGSYKATQEGKPSWTVAVTTPDTYDTVKTAIVDKFNSWTKSSEYESSGTMINVYDKDGLSVVITVTQPNQTTDKTKNVVINYSVTPQ